jgi:RES domain
VTRPAVPSAGKLSLLVDELPAGTELLRVYDRRWGPLGFNPTASSARFRPITDADRTIVPSAYLASDEETAIAESVLRGVSALARGGIRRRIYAFEVDPLDMCRLRLERPVRVARLHGLGLTRLGLRREDVIDCDEAEYPYTAEWAQAIWGARSRPHGIAWTSRQNDSGRAYVLWEGRVKRGTLTDPYAAVRFDRDPGRELVRQACVAADIDFDG